MAITNASRLADFGAGIGTQGAILQVDNANQRVGIGTTNPTSKLNVVGDVTVTSGTITAPSASFSGNVSIGGTLTYEDVTNIDSLGIVTARTGVKVLAGGINVVGPSTFSNNVNVGTGITMYSSTGIVSATSFYGNGSGLTGLNIPAGYTELDGMLFG